MKLCYHWLSRRRFAKCTLPLVVDMRRALTPPSCNQPQGSNGHSSKVASASISFLALLKASRAEGLFQNPSAHKQTACRLTIPRRSKSISAYPAPHYNSSSNRRFAYLYQDNLATKEHGPCHHSGSFKGIASQACSGAKSGQLPYGIMRAAHKTLRHIRGLDCNRLMQV